MLNGVCFGVWWATDKGRVAVGCGGGLWVGVVAVLGRDLAGDGSDEAAMMPSQKKC